MQVNDVLSVGFQHVVLVVPCNVGVQRGSTWCLSSSSSYKVLGVSPYAACYAVKLRAWCQALKTASLLMR